MWLSNIFLKTLRDYRVAIFGWGIGMGLVVVSPMASVKALITTQEERDQLVSLAATFAWNADVVAVGIYAGADLARVESAVTDGEHPKGGSVSASPA